ncbi:NADPH-dependent 7-cyano-7-deazaguanine reductase QueF [Proteobacteria bacterium 005FR1]|nr:NADPH-dependent 7-cyano-7-deazaguanine reductase QueF [Proteobacteria bacterium 005FR1]
MTTDKKPAGAVADSPLGKTTEYISVYTPSLLSPIPREESRRALGLSAELPFRGMDLWTAFEMSWLNPRGKPQVAVGRFAFPAHSPAIIESKSFKLYLNSLNQTRFESRDELIGVLEKDLSAAAGASVSVAVVSLAEAGQGGIAEPGGECIDDLEIEVDSYELNPDFLHSDDSAELVEEALYSDLLKSNCPVTGQPDWASVMVRYRGRPIDREGLLQYIISFREHGDFHENCVERMFMDIMQRCAPKQLTVSARYTRRGGLDINPYRSNCGEEVADLRLARQ